MDIIILKNNSKYYDIAIPQLYTIFDKTQFKSIDDIKLYYHALKNITTYICLNKKTNEYIGSYLLQEVNNKIFLCDLFIVPKYRKKGLGTKLIKDAKKKTFRLFRYFKLYLNTYKKNINFYKINNFEYISYDNKTQQYLFACDIYKLNNYIFFGIYLLIFICVTLYYLFTR